MGKPVRIYFDINDAKIFKVKVGQSLKEQKGKGFNPDNMMLNPGGRKIDHIHRDFHNTEKRKLAYYGSCKNRDQYGHSY
jgi:hypothetical protein